MPDTPTSITTDGTAQRSQPRPRRPHRTVVMAWLMALTLALAAGGTMSTATVAEADAGAGGAGASPVRTKQLLVASGRGRLTGELPFCFNGSPGLCGWIVQGQHTGTPIRSGTFFAAIDNGHAVEPRRCVPASYTGLLHETLDDAIAQVGEGRLCPNGTGGHVFAGRVDVTGINGRFRDLGSGRGHVLVAIASNGSSTFTLTGLIRTS